MTKKILSLLLSVIMVFALSACENDDKNNKYDDDYEYEEEYNENDYYNDTVYVSKSGKKVHSIPNCSGMKYYIKMTYRKAESNGYAFCKNCW